MSGKPRFDTKMKKWSSRCTPSQADNIQHWAYELKYNQQSDYFRDLANPSALYDRLKDYFDG